ncbi:MAG: amidohydrolase family protein [Acidobacteriia bacterium]|nr:amidohydrolase family protein [Terriglobia bacterium]
MVDVLLTHSYHLYYDRKQARKMQPYPPLGTLYAAARSRHDSSRPRASVEFRVLATEEIATLEDADPFDLGGLDARTLIIHGVGLDAPGRALLETRGGALVWCPSSNVFTLGRTLDRSALRRHRRVALGSDSALTAEGGLLDEVRFACECARSSPEKAFTAVTSGTDEALRLTDGEGSLEPGAVADAIAIPDAGEPPATTLCKSSFRDVECVIVGGKPRLLSPRLARRRAPGCGGEFSRLLIDGIKRLLDAPAIRLFEQAKELLPSGFCLAGKQVQI